MGKCHRGNDCRYVHLTEGAVEVTNGRVTVCRDAVKGRCQRPGSCKYYHIPLFAAAAAVTTDTYSRPVIT